MIILGSTQALPIKWTLPAVSPGAYPLDRIEFTTSSEVASLLSFDEQSREVSFLGEDESSLDAFISNNPNISEIFSQITFNLVDTEGSFASYEQTLIITLPDEVDHTIEEDQNEEE